MTIKSETSDFNIVRDVMKRTPLLSLKLRWDWKEFDWLYVFEFSGKWMYKAAYDPYMEDLIWVRDYYKKQLPK